MQLFKNNSQPPAKGYYEVEGPHDASTLDDKILRVYGNLDFLNNAECADCVEITFMYVDVDSIARRAGEILRKMRRLRTVCLRNNAVRTLTQVSKLGAFFNRTEEGPKDLVVSYEGNPVVASNLFRFFTAFMIPELRVLNLRDVTDAERSRGTLLFNELRRGTGFDREMNAR